MSAPLDTLTRKALSRLHDRPRATRAVLWLSAFVHESDRNELFIRAATLIYPTLLSIVPVLAVVFAVMDIVGGDAASRVANLTISLFLTDAVSPVGAELERMLDGVNFAGLGIVGIIGVLVTSASVYFRVEHTYNALWNASSRRGWMVRAMMFYTTLTLAPLLLAWGFHFSDVLAARPGGAWVGFLTPVLVAALAFVAPIKLVPETPVQWGPAILGGMFSASLFELAQFGFNAYVRMMGSANPVTRIYGSLGLLPVFLVWLFLVWTVVLLGVQLAYCIQRRVDLVAAEEFRLAERGDPRHHADAWFGVQCLLVVARRFLDGEGPTPEPTITHRLGTDPPFVADALETLTAVGILVETPGGFVPATPLDRLTLRDALLRYRERTRPQSGALSPGTGVLARLVGPGLAPLDDSIATLAALEESPPHAPPPASVTSPP